MAKNKLSILGGNMYKKFLLAAIFTSVLIGCSSESTESTNSNGTISVVSAGGAFSNPLGLIYLTQNDAEYTTSIAKNAAGSQITTNQDSIVRTYNDKIYVFGRDSNSAVLVLDNSGDNKDPIANYSLAELDPDGDFDIDGGFNGTNPYEIAFESESIAYVAFYNSNYILKINPLTGNRLNSINVSFVKTIAGATASDANSPNIVDVELISGKLYILAQRFNAAFEPLESAIVIYDTQTEEFVDTNTDTEEIDGIILSGKNPSEMIYMSSSNKLLVAHRGAITYTEDFSAIESTEIGSTGIEEVLVESNSTNGIIIPGTAFGGSNGGFGVGKLLYNSASGKIFAAYDAFDFSSNIKEINLTSLTVASSSILSSNATAFGDSTIDGDGFIYLINRSSTSPSIDVYNSNTKTLIKSIATELPMQSIAIVK